ncbi:hypothetical protein M9458_032055, partial [Cirrhinus mrigala]
NKHGFLLGKDRWINSQDSLEFPGDPHHGGFPQNSHGFGGQPEPYPIGPVGVNQFDYQ